MPRCLIEHFIVSSVSCEYLDNEERQVRSRDGDIQQDIGQITGTAVLHSGLGQAHNLSGQFLVDSQHLTAPAITDISLQSSPQTFH